MTRLKLPALLLGATALTVPLATGAGAQTQTQQQNQQAATQQGTELGACEQLYRLIDEAAGEQILEEFQRAPDVAEQNQVEECALIVRQVEETGGISREAVAEGRGTRVITQSETFRASDTVRETVEIEQQAIVQGEVIVRQPTPEIDVEQPGAEVEITERPVGVDIEQRPARIEINQQPANVRVSVPQPTITIEQPAPEIVITMPPPGVSVARQEPQVAINMPDPRITVAQGEPEVDVNVQAQLVGAEEIAQFEQQGRTPQVQTRTERIPGADGDAEAQVSFNKGEPQVRYITTDSQGQRDDVRYRSANPEVVYQAAEPNVEVAYDQEQPQIEIRQVGEPQVRLVQDESQQQNQQAQLQGQQQTEPMQQPQQGQQQAGQMQATQQGTQGQGAFTAEVARGEGDVEQVALRLQTAGQALEQQDPETARAEIEEANRQLQAAMEQTGEEGRQQMQSLAEQLELVVVSIDEDDLIGAETALADAEANLQQNRARWAGEQQLGQQQAAVGDGQLTTAPRRLSLEDTNRLLGEGFGQEVQIGMTSIAAGDLQNLDVITMNGEDLGDIERIVVSRDRIYAIIEHGGFLGIGQDRVAIPADRIALRGDEAVLLGLSEEDIEAMPEYNFENDTEMASGDAVEIGRFE